MNELPGHARLFGLVGTLFGFLSVALGAFGAHGLRARLAPRDLEIFEIGVRYQMYHGLALLGVAWLLGREAASLAGIAGWAFTAGTVVFSGTLYVVALGGPRWLGAVTPFGGAMLLAGWALMAWGFLQGT